MEWGDRWLVAFNATKTKLLSFNRHRDPLLVPVEMNGIELPEETSFHLLGLTFTRPMDWKPYLQSIANVASRKVGSLYRAHRFLTPESILYLYKSTIRPCMEYCSHIWGGVPRSHGLDLLGRVQKRVVSSVGSGLSSDFQALSHRRDVACSTSITVGNVPLSLRILYLPNASLFLSRPIVIQLILLCAGLSLINQVFYIAQQPFGTPSLMKAFHQITISQHSRGRLTSSCC